MGITMSAIYLEEQTSLRRPHTYSLSSQQFSTPRILNHFTLKKILEINQNVRRWGNCFPICIEVQVASAMPICLPCSGPLVWLSHWWGKGLACVWPLNARSKCVNQNAGVLGVTTDGSAEKKICWHVKGVQANLHHTLSMSVAHAHTHTFTHTLWLPIS